MGTISTKELFDRYFAGPGKSVEKKTRAQYDRPEVYAYEQKIGKELIDMTDIELLDMVKTFKKQNKEDTDRRQIQYRSYHLLASGYSRIFQYYIDSDWGVFIRNPWKNQTMLARNALGYLFEGLEPFSKDSLQGLINRIHEDYAVDRANYLECILLLFYDGVYDAEELIDIKKEDIDFLNKTVRCGNKVVQLSDRCFGLFVDIHHKDSIDGHPLQSWNGSYFKYTIKPIYASEFNDKDKGRTAFRINQVIDVFITGFYKTDLDNKILFYLGFYDRLVEKYGADMTKDMITSYRDRRYSDILLMEASKLDIKEGSSVLKRKLQMYVP